MKILARVLVVNGSSYVDKFSDKTGGFVIMRYRLRRWWNITTLWPICFAILFGHDVATIEFDRPFGLYSLVETFNPGPETKAVYSGILPVIVAMLQNGLKTITKDQQDPESPSDDRVNGNRNPGESATRLTGHIRKRSMSLHTEVVSMSKSLRFNMLQRGLTRLQRLRNRLLSASTNRRRLYKR